MPTAAKLTPAENAEKASKFLSQPKKKTKKPVKKNVGIVTPADVKLGQELSASILEELQNKTNQLSKSYLSKGSSLPMGLVWPVDAQPTRMIPKGDKKYQYPMR